jgi:hypothetical protein
LNDLISGDVGKSMDSYREQHADLQVTIQDTQKEIDKLSKLKVLTPAQTEQVNKLWQELQQAKNKAGEFAQMSDGELKKAIKNLNSEIWTLTNGSYLTDDQKKELETLKGKLDDAKGKMSELNSTFEESSKKMLFNMLLTKAASDGLTTTEVDNLTTIALHWGLVDQASATTAQQLNAIDLTNAKVELSYVDNILTHIGNLPKSYTFSVTTNYTANYATNRGNPTSPSVGGYVDPGTGSHYANGGSFTVPSWAGYEGFNMGGIATASARETVTVTPAGDDTQKQILAALQRLPAQFRDMMQQVAG